MEQHPVPQNVTTFQFRLVGDMTIKQFGYLAGGAILAYIFYKLPLPFFFTWPLAAIAGFAGFGFAFIPVEERPMDVWVFSFIKNIYSPTQFVWEKTQRPQAAPHIATPKPSPPAQGAQLSRTVQTIFTPTQNQPAQPAKSSASILSGLFARNISAPSAPVAPTPTTTTAIPTPSITGKRLDVSVPPKITAPTISLQNNGELSESTLKKQQELDAKTKELTRELEVNTATHARVLELQKQLTEILAERDKMRSEIAMLKRGAQPNSPAPVPLTKSTVASSVPASSDPTVRIITPEGAVKAGLPRLTTFPNVVTGIVRDADRNFLPGVLVTVRDSDGVPLRALKTNRLGQFAASTPIANGTYFVEIEDPRSRFVFDRVQVTLNGSIVPAIEVVAKSQKEVNRDRLAKELFGGQ